MGHAVAGSDLVATLPRTFGEHFAAILSLQLRPFPFEMPGFSVSQHRDPAHGWLRQLVKELMAGGEASSGPTAGRS